MPYEKVTYNAEQFIQCCFGECVEYARRYVKDNPKDEYSTDDFMEVYRMKELEEGWKISKYRDKTYPNYGHWYDEDVERLVDIWEGD